MELMAKTDEETAQLLCGLNPIHQLNDDGVIHLKSIKALHEHIEAAQQLFYNDLNKSLTTMIGFKNNKCDPCIHNKKMTDGAITIRVHVDDLNISPSSTKQL
jgi:hypothetical protein